jgi:hypothetical protein
VNIADASNQTEDLIVFDLIVNPLLIVKTFLSNQSFEPAFPQKRSCKVAMTIVASLPASE